MDSIKSFLISITGAGIITAILVQITGTKSATGKIVKIITGVFMLVTLLSPMISFRLEDIDQYIEDFRLSSKEAVRDGIEMASEEMEGIIKSQTESYILDEANKMGIEMRVEVKLSDSSPPQPCFVTLQGVVSPYQKKYLTQQITEHLGISQENQRWI